MPLKERPSRSRLTATTPFGSELDRVDFDSVLLVSIGRPGPVTTPPGWGAGADRDPLLTRDELGMRLGERETVDLELPELDDSPLDPELLEPELPLELDPDDPEEPDEPEEPDDPEEPLPRGTAWAPATLGAASANETTRLSARRVDLAMVVLPRSQDLCGRLKCNSTATRQCP